MSIPMTHVQQWCKIGQGPLTCSYLIAGPDGFACAKGNRAIRRTIDNARLAGTMKAKGDNCPGYVEATA